MSEEKHWSDIVEDARSKAASDINSLVNEIRPKVKGLVEQARKANFREEVDSLLNKLREIADELTESKEEEPKKENPEKTYRYKDDKGKYYERASKKWTKAQKEEYRLSK